MTTTNSERSSRYREHENGEVSTTLRMRCDRATLDALVNMTAQERADAVSLAVIVAELGLSRGDGELVTLADRARIVADVRDRVRDAGLLSPRLEALLRESFV